MSDSVPIRHQGINKLPDELLTNILALVTFSEEQFITLMDVNTRFRRITASGSYRMQVLRTQFPDTTALQRIKTITQSEYFRVAFRSMEIEIIFQQICPEEANETRRAMLLTGLYLLEHFFTTAHDHQLDAHQRLMLARWAMDTISGLTAYSMRYVLERLYRVFYTPGSTVVPFPGLPRQEPKQNVPLSELLMMRAFESVVVNQSKYPISNIAFREQARCHTSGQYHCARSAPLGLSRRRCRGIIFLVTTSFINSIKATAVGQELFMAPIKQRKASSMGSTFARAYAGESGGGHR